MGLLAGRGHHLTRQRAGRIDSCDLVERVREILPEEREPHPGGSTEHAGDPAGTRSDGGGVASRGDREEREMGSHDIADLIDVDSEGPVDEDIADSADL